MKLRAAIAAIALLLSLSAPVSASGAANSVDPNPRMVANLRNCAGASDFDCIQAVFTVNADGVATPVKFLSYQNNGSHKDEQGNTHYDGQLNYAGMSMVAELETPNHRIFKNLTGGALRLFITPDAAHTKSLYKIQFRTSWLKPQDIQMKAESANYSMKEIEGGRFWTFYGKQTQMSFYNSNFEKKMATGARADTTFGAFEIFIHHSDPNGSYFPTRCDDYGFTVESHNAPGAGQPYWNSQTESLEFNIQAPHLKANGSLNIGFFQFWATDEYMECAWPENTISKAKNVLVVSVIDQDGEVQIAAGYVSHADGTMVVSVKGLHFSKPTIRVSEAKPASGSSSTGATVGATPTPKPEVKTTITCVKGKTTKKVTAVSPKCPAGYKKK